MNNNKNNEKGFTLIEVLIALVIVTLSFSAIIYSVNQNVRNLVSLDDTVASTWVAEEVLTRSQLGLLKANSGTQRMLNRDWRWEIKIKSKSEQFLQELQINVYNQQKQKVLTMTAYNGVYDAR